MKHKSFYLCGSVNLPQDIVLTELRMLGICLEFERIAKVGLDKAEKESHSRRKRKSNKEMDSHTQQPFNSISQPPNGLLTPSSQGQQHLPTTLAPEFPGGLNGQSFNPDLNGQFGGFGSGDLPTPLDFSSMMNNPSSMPPLFPGLDFNQMNAQGESSINMSSFQQPFVPQDLWQIPQTLEWDWAEMGNIGYPAFDAVAGENPSSTDDPNLT